MRVWFSGPRVLGIRTGLSVGPADFRRGWSLAAAEGTGGYVYVIQRDGDHRLKIGSSTNPPARLASLQTGSADPLTIAYTLHVHGDHVAVEHEAHAILDRHRGLGEWFAVPPDVAVAAINAAAYRLGDRSSGGPLPTAGIPMPAWAWALLALPFWLGVGLNQPWVALPYLFTVGVWGVLRLWRQASRGLTGFPRLVGGMLAAPISAVIILLVCGAVRADDRPALPIYDSAAYCQKLGALFANNAVLKDGCEKSQQSSKADLVRVWPSSPPKLELDCIRLMSAGGQEHYDALSGCLSAAVGNAWMRGDLKLTPAP